MIPYYKVTCPLCGNEVAPSEASVKTIHIKSRERNVITCPHCDKEFGIDIIPKEGEVLGLND